MRKVVIALVFVFGIFSSLFSQNSGAVSVSAGTGFSVFLTSMKTGLNIALNELELSKISGTPMFVSSVNVGVNENFTIGFGYTENKFNWQDRFVKQLPDSSLFIYDTVKVEARVDLTRRNFGLKAMYLINPKDKFQAYFGVRLGVSVWNSVVEGDYQVGESEFSFPSSTFNFQAFLGGNWYFTEPVGMKFELGVGNAPYLVSIGICGRFNYR